MAYSETTTHFERNTTMFENADVIIADASLILITLVVVFVFARNIILQAKKNRRTRAMRIERAQSEKLRKANLNNMFTMLEKI